MGFEIKKEIYHVIMLSNYSYYKRPTGFSCISGLVLMVSPTSTNESCYFKALSFSIETCRRDSKASSNHLEANKSKNDTLTITLSLSKLMIFLCSSTKTCKTNYQKLTFFINTHNIIILISYQDTLFKLKPKFTFQNHYLSYPQIYIY